MEPDTLRSLLKKAAQLGCRSFHIGGGETFLNLKGLYQVLEIMQEEGVSLDYLETNASWYKDDESCAKVIDELANRGCGTVMVSVCPYHNEFIPLAKMEGVIKACQDRKMGLFLWQEQYYRHLSALDKDMTHSFEELEGIWGKNYFLKAGKRFGLTMNGRALESYRPYLPHKRAAEIIKDNSQGCAELEQTKHFHLDLNGNFIPPGCVGITVDHNDLGKELSQENYPHFLALRQGGVGELLKLAQEKGYSERPAGYASKCDLCGNIRHFLLNLGLNERVKDIGPADYYTE